MLIISKFLSRSKVPVQSASRFSYFMFSQQTQDVKQEGSEKIIPVKEKQKKIKKTKEPKKSAGEKGIKEPKENQVYSTVLINVKPDKINEFISVFQKLSVLSLKEKGCVRYELSQKIDIPHELIVWEIWKSQNDFISHTESAHFKEYVPQLNKLQQGPSELKKLTKIL